MNIRNREIKRLVNYAKGLGCTVKIKNVLTIKKNSSVAEMELDTNIIYLYITPKCSKISIVFSLIHEIAHYKGYIKRKRIVSIREDYVYGRYSKDKTLPLSLRKQIFKDEKKDLYYWNGIIKDCNIQINPNRIAMQKELDLLWYKLFVKYGYNFTIKCRNKHTKKIKQKYRLRRME